MKLRFFANHVLAKFKERGVRSTSDTAAIFDRCLDARYGEESSGLHMQIPATICVGAAKRAAAARTLQVQTGWRLACWTTGDCKGRSREPESCQLYWQVTQKVQDTSGGRLMAEEDISQEQSRKLNVIIALLLRQLLRDTDFGVRKKKGAGVLAVYLDRQGLGYQDIADVLDLPVASIGELVSRSKGDEEFAGGTSQQDASDCSGDQKNGLMTSHCGGRCYRGGRNLLGLH